jgi:hypothetical protein
MIQTWVQRCKKFGNEIVPNEKILQVMQSEIDELRKALEMRELSDEEIDVVWLSYKGDIKDFARAILKCASGNILSDNEAKD